MYDYLVHMTNFDNISPLYNFLNEYLLSNWDAVVEGLILFVLFIVFIFRCGI